MGLLPRLRELAYTVHEVVYRDGAGSARARLSYDQFSRALDSKLLSIMRPDLELALLESLPASAELRYGTTIEEVRDGTDGVSVVLSDGVELAADLLISAEGIHSPLRTQLFGAERNHRRYLGFHTAAFTFHDPELHTDLGPQFALTDTIDSQVGLYGLRGGHVAVFTVHRAADTGLPQDPRAEVQQRYAGLQWLVPRALQQCPDRIYYDEVAQIIMPRWHQGRVLLVGDAAHAVSLLAGQGASLAMAGAQALARELASSRDINSALEGYEQRWRPQVEEHQRAGRRAAAWFVPANRFWLLVRRLVLHLTSVPGLDRLFGQRLIGKTPVH